MSSGPVDMVKNRLSQPLTVDSASDLEWKIRCKGPFSPLGPAGSHPPGVLNGSHHEVRALGTHAQVSSRFSSTS